MATKFEQLTLLYQETIKRISKDEEAWMDFLKSSCRNYRLSFADMVLIYAQRPEAKAVLEMEAWNKRYSLWIKQGSKGIAVFDPDYSSARIKYYFDIADTRKTKFYRPVPIWSMKPEYEQEVISALNDKFDILDNDSTIEEAILSASANIVEDNISDYLTDLHYCIEDSLLEELDEQNLEIIYKSVLTNTIAYSVLTRCDIDAQLYISEDDLRLISQFNTPELLNALGVTSRDMTQMVLGEVRTAVLNCIRQPNRTFELKDTNLYNKTEKKKRMKKGALNKMKIEYIQQGDYQIPNLTLKPEDNIQLGKYALMRKRYLKEHRPILFTNYLTTQTLNQHLMEIDKTANQRKELLMKQLMEQQKVNEQLKEVNQMLWVQMMNNIEATVHEIICKELIYS